MLTLRMLATEEYKLNQKHDPSLLTASEIVFKINLYSELDQT
jgi:hypothetical protein